MWAVMGSRPIIIDGFMPGIMAGDMPRLPIPIPVFRGASKWSGMYPDI